MTANVSLTISIDHVQPRPFLLDRITGLQISRTAPPCKSSRAQYRNRLHASTYCYHRYRHTLLRGNIFVMTTNVNIEIIGYFLHRKECL